MYRVVLIDDENIIVEGLRRVIKWADYGCEVVGTASGAEEGAALIRKLQPHILFTDIRMPGADGLTMLAALRSEFPDMQVTVLTGYQDFSYAQQAIRLGVTRFLLKPSKMDEIKEALVTMTTRLDAQSQLRHQEEEPEEEQLHRQSGDGLHRGALRGKADTTGGGGLLLCFPVAPVEAVEPAHGSELLRHPQHRAHPEGKRTAA